MTQEFDREAVMRKVQKLLAIAEHDRSDPNEAAAAAAMAAKIMRKYQLEYAEVIMTALKAGDDLSTGDYVASAKTNGTPVKEVPPWADYIAVAVARLNDCGVRKSPVGKHIGLRFYGYSADVQVAIYMMEFLCGTVIRLGNEFKKTPEYEQSGRRILNSYRHGLSLGIVSKLKGMLAEKKAEESSTGTALVVVKQAAVTEKYGDFGYVTKKQPTKHVSTLQGDSFAKGYTTGKNIGINTAVKGQSSDAKFLN